MNNDETRLIRAAYSARTITIYQAYSPEIAGQAVRAGTFVPPFSRDRMTWIKPSFGWMMHRSGWGAKPGQERILAVDISRSGFEAHPCASNGILTARFKAPSCPEGRSKSACPARLYTTTSRTGSAPSPT
jgi:Domain of unknown function (DUF4291)